MKDVLKKTITHAAEKFAAQYVEAEPNSKQNIFTMKKAASKRQARHRKRVALRVLVNGAWGFASVGSFDADVLVEAVSDACSMATAASLRLSEPIVLAPSKPVEDRVELKPKKDPSQVSIEEKIALGSA